jgi:hypothetical protein
MNHPMITMLGAARITHSPDAGDHIVRTVVVGACDVALFLGACTVANTPQQDQAYARGDRVQRAVAQLQLVDLAARITFQFTSASEPVEIRRCLAEAGRTGPSLPEPLGVGPRGGQ